MSFGLDYETDYKCIECGKTMRMTSEEHKRCGGVCEECSERKKRAEESIGEKAERGARKVAYIGRGLFTEIIKGVSDGIQNAKSASDDGYIMDEAHRDIYGRKRTIDLDFGDSDKKSDSEDK